MPVERRGMRALLIWCQRVTQDYRSKGVKVEDFTGSFRDGLAFCAIIHHFRPELIGDFDRLKPEDVLENNRLAFTVAEEKLDVPSLLDPEDMADCEVQDKFSIVTYLSQLYHLFKDQDGSRMTNSLTTSTRISESSNCENDSLLQSSSSESESTPASKKREGFSREELIAKYGEEIFSTAKDSSSSDDDEKSVNEEEVEVEQSKIEETKREIEVKSNEVKCEIESIEVKTTEVKSETIMTPPTKTKVRTDSPMVRAKFGGVGAICKGIEERMKVFEKAS